MAPPLEQLMRIVAVIPARLASSRLPGKVLRPIAGVPMLGWVYRAALACPQLEQVLIATDSPEVVAYADSQGWPSVMTSSALASGTDRVQAVATLVDADIYVNIQGDEPLLRPEHIDSLLRPFAPLYTGTGQRSQRGESGHGERWQSALLLSRHDSVPEGHSLDPA